jgi:predicted DNA-binding WGR domain protein
MRLLLQQRAEGREAPRFVQLMLEPDLLGGWALVRETGQIGGRSQLKREQFLDQVSAQAAFEQARDAQLKKGFQLMFAQGAEARQQVVVSPPISYESAQCGCVRRSGR